MKEELTLGLAMNSSGKWGMMVSEAQVLLINLPLWALILLSMGAGFFLVCIIYYIFNNMHPPCCRGVEH